MNFIRSNGSFSSGLPSIQSNSVILFYRKIREVISYHLALKADEVFDGQIELDESYFGGHRKENEVEVQQEKWLFLGY